MKLTETVKLYLTKEQKSLIADSMKEYIKTVNSIVTDGVLGKKISKYTTASFEASLPSALKNQCIRDAKSLYRKYLKKKKENSKENPTIPVVRKACCYINNQNYKLVDGRIEFPMLIEGKSERISVSTRITQRQSLILENSKLGLMRIVYKGNKLVAQFSYEKKEQEEAVNGKVMGVDLGIKCPAVSYVSGGGVKFYGNGRRNKYLRRYYRNFRRKLQKAKKISVVRKINNKEQRWMRDEDHKLSRSIVNNAVANNVKVIKLERLTNIRSTTRTSRKNNPSLHSWSFYRLSKFIEYKAKLAGITVEYVNPAYTSQRCPVCGHVHHANDRKYTCQCGFKCHRDLVGAINISNSPEYVGDSDIRHTA